MDHGSRRGTRVEQDDGTQIVARVWTTMKHPEADVRCDVVSNSHGAGEIAIPTQHMDD